MRLRSAVALARTVRIVRSISPSVPAGVVGSVVGGLTDSSGFDNSAADGSDLKGSCLDPSGRTGAGRGRLAREGVRVAPTTIWRLLRRCRLGTRCARLAVLEQHSAATTGLLTERTARPHRHVEAAQPGDLLSLDTFYVGKLKGVGKVWQITGCDVASSFD